MVVSLESQLGNGKESYPRISGLYSPWTTSTLQTQELGNRLDKLVMMVGYWYRKWKCTV